MLTSFDLGSQGSRIRMLKCAVDSLLLIPPLSSSTSVQIYQENMSLILQKQIYLMCFFSIKYSVFVFVPPHNSIWVREKIPGNSSYIGKSCESKCLLLFLYFLIWNWKVALITCTAHRVCAHRCLALVERRSFPRETQAGSKSRKNSGHPLPWSLSFIFWYVFLCSSFIWKQSKEV